MGKRGTKQSKAKFIIIKRRWEEGSKEDRKGRSRFSVRREKVRKVAQEMDWEKERGR